MAASRKFNNLPPATAANLKDSRLSRFQIARSGRLNKVGLERRFIAESQIPIARSIVAIRRMTTHGLLAVFEIFVFVVVTVFHCAVVEELFAVVFSGFCVFGELFFSLFVSVSFCRLRRLLAWSRSEP